MLKKQYVKSRDECKVTFELAFSELPEGLEVKSVSLVGDFNCNASSGIGQMASSR